MTNDVTMTGEIIDAAPDAVELTTISTDALHERLRGAIGMTEQAIRSVAMLWHELVRRGEDMSRYRMALAPYMLPVADGRLLPALVVQMSGQLRALQRLAELPVTDQARLLAGAPIEVYRGEGRTEAKPLADLTFSDIALAVRDGHIRTAAEQRLAYDRSQPNRHKRRAGRPVKIVITVDGNIRLGKTEVEAERVIAALRASGLI